MDTQIIRKQLLSISAIVNSLLAELEEQKQSATKEARKERVFCPVCDLPFSDKDPDDGNTEEVARESYLIVFADEWKKAIGGAAQIVPHKATETKGKPRKKNPSDQ